MPSRPTFDSLPLDPNGPPGNAWGLYGPDDELGTLNLLTSDVVAAAAQEIKTGERVSLDWPLDRPAKPSFGRESFRKEFVQRAPRSVNDDTLIFNTQCSSQWDGYRHYGYQKAQRYYNGRKQDQLSNSDVMGIDAWTTQTGGLVSRGILLDYPRYCSQHNLSISAMSSVSVPFKHIEGMLASQNLVPRTGDILFLRMGFTQAYNSLSTAEQDSLSARASPDFIGLEASLATLRWIWDSGFAAVAGDTPSFERAPIAGPHTQMTEGGERIWKDMPWEEEMQGGGLLHQWLLAGWGCPIGEMFDLEKLAEVCERNGRWSFFVTSAPLKVPGGVASPPNAIAIF